MLTMKDIIREGNPTLRAVCDEVPVPLTAEDIQLGKDMLEFLHNSQDPEMAEKYELPILEDREVIEPTLVSLTVSDKIAGKYVRDLVLPKNVLITMQVSDQHSEVVSGSTRLNAGDTIFLVVNEPDIGKIRSLLM